MKTLVILGLIACVAFAAPVASAHIIIETGGSEEECDANAIVIDVPVHAWVGVGPCEFDHE